MSEDPYKDQDYLGDGVYAYFDGFSIWLRANEPVDKVNPQEGGICLEPSALSALNRFNERMHA